MKKKYIEKRVRRGMTLVRARLFSFFSGDPSIIVHSGYISTPPSWVSDSNSRQSDMKEKNETILPLSTIV